MLDPLMGSSRGGKLEGPASRRLPIPHQISTCTVSVKYRCNLFSESAGIIPGKCATTYPDARAMREFPLIWILPGPKEETVYWSFVALTAEVIGPVWLPTRQNMKSSTWLGNLRLTRLRMPSVDWAVAVAAAASAETIKFKSCILNQSAAVKSKAMSESLGRESRRRCPQST